MAQLLSKLDSKISPSSDNEGDADSSLDESAQTMTNDEKSSDGDSVDNDSDVLLEESDKIMMWMSLHIPLLMMMTAGSEM